MGKVISFFNQKGGVGKTTAVVNLGYALGQEGKKVLIVDVDPQGNASSGFGVDKNSLDCSVYELILSHCDISQALIKSRNLMVDILPANAELAGLEIELIQVDKREFRLKDELDKIVDDYDYILIDCPPSLGQLSINALVASDSIIIPIQTEYYALEGVSQLLNTVDLIKGGLNPNLGLEGVLISMYDGRNNLSNEVRMEIEHYFKEKVFKSIIPRNITVAEAPSHGKSVVEYEPSSKGAVAFVSLAKELIERGKDD